MQHHGFYGCNIGESRGSDIEHFCVPFCVSNDVFFVGQSVTDCVGLFRSPNKPCIKYTSIENSIAWNIISVFYLNV